MDREKELPPIHRATQIPNLQSKAGQCDTLGTVRGIVGKPQGCRYRSRTGGTEADVNDATCPYVKGCAAGSAHNREPIRISTGDTPGKIEESSRTCVFNGFSQCLSGSSLHQSEAEGGRTERDNRRIHRMRDTG